MSVELHPRVVREIEQILGSLEPEIYNPDDRLRSLRAVLIMPASFIGVLAGIALGIQVSSELVYPILSGFTMIGSSFGGLSTGAVIGELAAVTVNNLMRR